MKKIKIANCNFHNKTNLVHCCDIVTNLVVEIGNFNFCLFVCLYLTFCQFRKMKMVQSWFQKLFWKKDCDSVSNLVVEIAICNFDLFHSALLNNNWMEKKVLELLNQDWDMIFFTQKLRMVLDCTLLHKQCKQCKQCIARCYRNLW